MPDHDNRLALYVAIVNDGDARRVIEISREAGLYGATVFYGLGTMNKGFFAALGLADVRKEIVLMVADTERGDIAADRIRENMQMHRSHKGIVFSIAVESMFGSAALAPFSNRENKEVTMENQAILTIVDKGRAELVMDAAAAAGATGGTIINARGSGIHETKKIFNIPIEPEKEIVLNIVPVAVAEKIASAIRTKLQIDEPGRGIVFVLDVRTAYGLFKKG
jgi:nitrogen regulatory protein PII